MSKNIKNLVIYQKWDGKLPTTVAGGSGTFLNIK